MQQLLAVWLVPQKQDEEYLKKIIEDLAKKNNSPAFIPHLTLFGDTVIEPDDLKNAIDKVFGNVKPFEIKKTDISQSELFFKTVFAEFEKSTVLKNLFNALSKEAVKKNINDFKPHISLMYKLMPKEKKLKIIELLKIKDTYTIDRVVINAPGSGQKDFLDVESWQSLYIKKLND